MDRGPPCALTALRTAVRDLPVDMPVTWVTGRHRDPVKPVPDNRKHAMTPSGRHSDIQRQRTEAVSSDKHQDTGGQWPEVYTMGCRSGNHGSQGQRDRKPGWLPHCGHQGPVGGQDSQSGDQKFGTRRDSLGRVSIPCRGCPMSSQLRGSQGLRPSSPHHLGSGGWARDSHRDPLSPSTPSPQAVSFSLRGFLPFPECQALPPYTPSLPPGNSLYPTLCPLSPESR